MLTAAALLVLQVAVADTTKPKPFPVKFQGDLGYVSTAGNTSVETLNFGNRITGTFGSVVFTQTFNGVSGKSKGAVVTSLWRGSFRADVKLENTFTAYSLTTYERNRFAGLASRVGNIIGLSAQVMRGPRNRLSIEGGVSLTAQRGIAPRGRDLDFLGGRAATTFSHAFGPKASLTQSVELLPNFREGEDLRINTESAVVAPLTRQVGVKLSYVIRYDGLPENGFGTTDRLFTSGLQVTL